MELNVLKMQYNYYKLNIRYKIENLNHKVSDKIIFSNKCLIN